MRLLTASDFMPFLFRRARCAMFVSRFACERRQEFKEPGRVPSHEPVVEAVRPIPPVAKSNSSLLHPDRGAGAFDPYRGRSKFSRSDSGGVGLRPQPPANVCHPYRDEFHATSESELREYVDGTKTNQTAPPRHRNKSSIFRSLHYGRSAGEIDSRPPLATPAGSYAGSWTGSYGSVGIDNRGDRDSLKQWHDREGSVYWGLGLAPMHRRMSCCEFADPPSPCSRSVCRSPRPPAWQWT